MKKRGQAVRDKIVATAGKLFYQQGYYPTGINQLIDEADIAKASLYKHFGSKTDLLLAYVRDYNENWFVGFADFVSEMNDPQERLLALFDYRSQRQASFSYGGCGLIKVNHEVGPSDPHIVELISEGKQRLKTLIAELVESSGHRQLLSSEELSETIYLMAEGGIVAASIFKHSDDLQEGKKIIRKLL